MRLKPKKEELERRVRGGRIFPEPELVRSPARARLLHADSG